MHKIISAGDGCEDKMQHGGDWLAEWTGRPLGGGDIEHPLQTEQVPPCIPPPLLALLACPHGLGTSHMARSLVGP